VVEGFGAGTTGGTGGTVYYVTNLNDSGAGSLRDVINRQGKRIIKFSVSGTIQLQSNITLSQPFVTIDGGDAPNGGIAIKGGKLTITTYEIIIRYIRFRPGPNVPQPNGDAIAIDSSSCYNIVIDHCSLSWATDENLSIYGHDLSIQWCIISEGLYCSTNPNGCNSYALLTGPFANRVSIHHNLLANNSKRHPETQGGLIEFVNNVIYNYQNPTVFVTKTSSDSIDFDAIGNYYKKGPISNDRYEIERSDNNWSGTMRLYVEGDIGPHRTSDSQPQNLVVEPYNTRPYLVGTRRVNPPDITISSAFDAYDAVLANAGANLPCQDEVDQRIVNDVITGAGGLISDPSEVGGWPDLTSSCGSTPPPMPTVQFTTTSSSGLESVTTVNIPVTLSSSSTLPVTASYAVTGGTATGGGVDYTLPSGTLTFAPGETSKNISATIVNDNATEPNETIIITLSNPSNAMLGANKIYTYTIIDNDAPANPFSASYEAETMVLTPPMTMGTDPNASAGMYISVTSGSNSSTPVREASLPFAVPQTGTYYFWVRVFGATPASDALFAGIDMAWDRVFPPTQGSYQWVRVETTNGSGSYGFNLAQGTHTFQIGHAEVGARADALFLTNDPNQMPTTSALPTVQFNFTNSSGLENVTPANLPVSLSTVSSLSVTVSYAVTGGTATGGGVDYTLPSGTLTFAPGETSKNISITIVDDNVSEANETIIVTLSNPTNADLGANSSATYTILDNDAQSITVLSPNGGENWAINSTQAITWNSTGVSGNVNILLSGDGGNNYQTILPNVPNTGSAQWVVAGPATTSARILVNSAANSAIADASNGNFTISNPSSGASITVLAPNGGETWLIGTTQTIQWTSNNVTGSIKIELSRDGGNTYTALINTTSNDGSFDWTVTSPSTTQAVIRISSADNPSISDTSNSLFKINNPVRTMTVVTPNGGEVWPINSTQTITWTSTNVDGPVKVELSRDSGNTYTALENTTSNDGSFTWTVRGPATTQAFIRITSVNYPNVSDRSNSVFRITQ
jgi:hypothetical protein